MKGNWMRFNLNCLLSMILLHFVMVFNILRMRRLHGMKEKG